MRKGMWKKIAACAMAVVMAGVARKTVVHQNHLHQKMWKP